MLSIYIYNWISVPRYEEKETGMGSFSLHYRTRTLYFRLKQQFHLTTPFQL